MLAMPRGTPSGWDAKLILKNGWNQVLKVRFVKLSRPDLIARIPGNPQMLDRSHVFAQNRDMRTKKNDLLSFVGNSSAGVSGSALFLTLLLFLSFPSFAAAHQARLILTVEAGQCTLRVEADDEARSLRLRILPEASDCYFTKNEMQSLLTRAFSKTAAPKLEGIYSSLFIGRLIDFPWLCDYLASAAYGDRMWDKSKGKPVSMNINKYVAALLSRRDVTIQLEEPIQASGYSIVDASVEKVLVGSFRDVPQYSGRMVQGKVPFDAMVWFRLEKR